MYFLIWILDVYLDMVIDNMILIRSTSSKWTENGFVDNVVFKNISLELLSVKENLSNASYMLLGLYTALAGSSISIGIGDQGNNS